MNKRHWILIIVLGVMVVGLGLTIFGGIFPAYGPVPQALAMLLVGFLSISGGIYEVQVAKAQGERILWWKHLPIILGLFLVCLNLGALVHPPILILVFSLLAVGFFIYGVILGFLQIAREKRLKQTVKVE